MTENDKDISNEAHMKFATMLYNLTWDLIDKKDRTPEEADMLLHAAHGSAYHWSQLRGQVGETRWQHSFAISHNQLTYAYIEVGNADQALFHAKRSLEYFDKYGEGGFPIAYGYECLAKAYDLADDIENRDDAIRKAIVEGNKIEIEDHRKGFFEELAKVRGYEEILAAT